jgi:hypothetical protein
MFFFFRLLFKTQTCPRCNKTVYVQWGLLFKNGGLLNEERLALALDGLRTLRRQVE